MILVDAGPLVALIHAGDKHHERCAEAFKTLDEPMATAWPSVTEAMYLLGFSWRAQAALWDFLQRGAVDVLPLDQDDMPRMRELMEKYRDLPMDFADAALVRLAEREKTRRIFTVDFRNFRIYRPKRFQSFTLLPE